MLIPASSCKMFLTTESFKELSVKEAPFFCPKMKYKKKLVLRFICFISTVSLLIFDMKTEPSYLLRITFMM